MSKIPAATERDDILKSCEVVRRILLHIHSSHARDAPLENSFSFGV